MLAVSVCRWERCPDQPGRERFPTDSVVSCRAKLVAAGTFKCSWGSDWDKHHLLA